MSQSLLQMSRLQIFTSQSHHHINLAALDQYKQSENAVYLGNYPITPALPYLIPSEMLLNFQMGGHMWNWMQRLVNIPLHIS